MPSCKSCAVFNCRAKAEKFFGDIPASASLKPKPPMIAARKADSNDRRQTASDAPDATLVDTILSLVRERPLLASGAAVAAGIYALRNPQLIAAVLKAFVDKPSNPRR